MPLVREVRVRGRDVVATAAISTKNIARRYVETVQRLARN
jgi:hypothetical protein